MSDRSTSTRSSEDAHKRIWNELEALSPGGPMTARRIHPGSERNLFLSYRYADRRRAFLLQVEKSALSSLSGLPELRGVEIVQTYLPTDGTGRLTVGMFLKEEKFFDVFVALVSDLAAHTAPSSTDAVAVQALITRLNMWQSFLENHAEGLTTEACQGLWGELYFLGEVAIRCIGSRAVIAWTGPERAPQDFQFPNCAVEVKTSIAMRGQGIRISNERQLDDAHVEHLFLNHLSLEPLRGAGETLPDLVSRVRALCASDGSAASILEDRLLEAGFLDSHASRYSAVGYSLREVNFFRVTTGFPRLIELDLPAGVGTISYSVTVDSCRPFAVSVADVEAVLQVAHEA